jgi:hypothetical protein
MRIAFTMDDLPICPHVPLPYATYRRRLQIVSSRPQVAIRSTASMPLPIPGRLTLIQRLAEYTAWTSAGQGGATDVDAVRQAMYGQRIKAPSGFEVVMNTNHHRSKPVMIGKTNSSGIFDVIWRSINPVRADVWNRYIPDSAKRTVDRTVPCVCGGCIEPIFREWV